LTSHVAPIAKVAFHLLDRRDNPSSKAQLSKLRGGDRLQG